MSNIDRLVHFLLVEDDEDHAQLVIRNLSKGRIKNRIDHVFTGEDALDYLKNEGEYADAERPDVVLLDIQLPGIDGHDVLAAIRKDEVLKSLPVVVLTTSDAEIDRAKAYEHHANSYLVKPLNFETFRTLVNDLSLYWGVWNQPPPSN